MAQNDLLKRYLDAGIHFTSLTQARAEALVKDLVKAGEVQADQARDAVTDLLERSRKSSESLLATIRKEVRAQITNLGLATQADLDRFEGRVQSLIGQAAAGAMAARHSSGLLKVGVRGGMGESIHGNRCPETGLATLEACKPEAIEGRTTPGE